MTPEQHERLAARLVSLLASIEDARMRALAAAREADALPAAALAAVIGVVVRRAATREPRSVTGLAAMGRALGSSSRERRREIRVAAEAAGLPEVAAWLAGGEPVRSPSARDLRDPPGLEGVSLGHRKVMARRRDPDVLARLASSGEPSVVHNLLENPRVTEADVVRLAARRPVRPATLEEIARSRRFEARPAVRRAIVRNPYAPVELALRLVPLLLGPELRDVAGDASLHPAVREEALHALAAREDRHGLAARERLAGREAEEARLRERLAAEEREGEDDLLALCAEIEAGVALRRVDDEDETA